MKKAILIAVGSPFPLALPANITNGAYFNFDQNGCKLIVILESPTKEEMSDLNSEKRAVFGIYKKVIW